MNELDIRQRMCELDKVIAINDATLDSLTHVLGGQGLNETTREVLTRERMDLVMLNLQRVQEYNRCLDELNKLGI